MMDKDLDFACGVADIVARFPYFAKSWGSGADQKVLVTGATRWLGRYLLYFLTDPLVTVQVFATDISPPPSYLHAERYTKVHYTPLADRQESLYQLIASLRPDIVLHADVTRDVTQEQFGLLYEVNVHPLEILCKAAKEHGTRRIITFSDSCVYNAGGYLAREGELLAPQLPLGRSFWEAEQIGATFHKPRDLEIYHLRLAPVYGPEVTDGAMAIVELVRRGFLLAPPQGDDRQISIVHGREVAIAALLVAAAPQPGYQVFNIAAEPVSLREFLQRLEKMLPKRHLFGMETRVAEIFGIGYQQEITIPPQFLEAMGTLAHQATNFFNYLRFEKHIPRLTRRSAQYFLSIRALSNKRLYDMLGWKPQYSFADLQETINHCEATNWRGFQTVRQADEYSEKFSIPLFDQVSEMVEALFSYSPETSANISSVYVPILDINIDAKSLWIVLERAWGYLPTLIARKGKKHSFVEFVSTAWESVLMLVEHEQAIAKRKFPKDDILRRKWLFQRMGAINGNRVQFYATVAGISRLLLFIRRYQQQYSPLLQLLPDKNYGFFVASKVGDIGIVIRVKNDKIVVSSMREEIDDFSHSWSFAKRVAEFKKISGYYTIGIRLERLLTDLLSGTSPDNFLKGLGKDYLLGDTTRDDLQLLRNQMSDSPVTHYLFLSRTKKVVFGVQVSNGQFTMVSTSYLEMVNRLLQEIPEHSQVEKMMREASNGREIITFLRIRTVKRLLAALMSTSRVSKIILRFMRRAARL